MSEIELPQVDNYRALFLENSCFLDVRAAIEFEQGAFPGAENLPLINDDERQQIGECYKKSGQDKAVELGHKLVQGDVKDSRIKKWQDFFEKNPQAVLYCFRGGMRSKITQQWLYETTGKVYPRVKGGYKAMRRFLIDELEKSIEEIKPVVLGGSTGIGKTVLLKKLNQKIDLEGIFHHRGSVFGKHVTAQPSQIDVENILSIELMRLREKQMTTLVFEDEAANIGSRRIPEVVYEKMKQSPLVVLEASIDERINITFDEYIIEALAEHQQFYGEEKGFTVWAEQLHQAIDKIERRLGGQRHKELKKHLSYAIEQQQKKGETKHHKDWIKSLLIDYYDPMYSFQISKKENRIVFKGQHNDVLAYLKNHYQIS